MSACQPDGPRDVAGRRNARKIFCAVLLLGVMVGHSGCQSLPPAKKREIRDSLEGYRTALNERSFDRLAPLLAEEVRVDAMPGDLSLAGLRAGMHWPPSPVSRVQILKLTGSPEAPVARIALYVRGGALLLRVGFDGAGRIRSIDDDPLWKPRGAVLRAPFTSPLVTCKGLPFVKGTVNGRSGFLLVDTGSSDLLLNSRIFSAEKNLGMPGIVSTVHGISPNAGRAAVRDLRWGNLTARGISGQLHDFQQMESPEISPLLGAIGFEQLRNSVVTFDWNAKAISLAAKSRPASPAASLRFQFFLHAPALTARIGGKSHRMVFDSGAAVNTLPSLAETAPHFRPWAASAKMSDGGRTGTADVPLGTIDAVQIGGITYRDMPFVIHEVPFLGGHGILGTPLLQAGRLEIDFPQQTVSLW